MILVGKFLPLIDFLHVLLLSKTAWSSMQASCHLCFLHGEMYHYGAWRKWSLNISQLSWNPFQDCVHGILPSRALNRQEFCSSEDQAEILLAMFHVMSLQPRVPWPLHPLPVHTCLQVCSREHFSLAGYPVRKLWRYSINLYDFLCTAALPFQQ